MSEQKFYLVRDGSGTSKVSFSIVKEKPDPTKFKFLKINPSNNNLALQFNTASSYKPKIFEITRQGNLIDFDEIENDLPIEGDRRNKFYLILCVFLGIQTYPYGLMRLQYQKLL